MSKHEEIIQYITGLKVGEKISVRGIAGFLNVSEGTAYRAIKECENLGVVTTIPRVGTVRVENIKKKNIETLTFGEVLSITDGTLIGGVDGIHKIVSKFVIAAMTLDEIEKYISQESLVIVGNREEVQEYVLQHGCGVLVTGAFIVSERIKKLANDKGLPVISSSYDTFTIATMINKAISDSMIKKDILMVEDIMSTDINYLKPYNKVKDFIKLIKETSHNKFPIIDDDENFIGIITVSQINADLDKEEVIGNIMIKDPITVTAKTTAAYAAHVMGWENGIEFCPVLQGKKVIGILSRKDVIKALQYMTRQPQVGYTIEDLIIKNFTLKNENEKTIFSGKITPEMLDPVGNASWSSLNLILSTMGIILLKGKNINIFVDSISTYFMKPLQMDSYVEIHSNIIYLTKDSSKVEISMYNDKNEIIGRSILSMRILNNKYINE